MKLKKRGKNILPIEVIQVSPHGIWLLIHSAEYFLPYEKFPWFKTATIAALHNVQLLHDNHLHWPDLDVDLELDSLVRPDTYPLVYT